MSSLLARHADAVFWLARYIERIESLARILDIHEAFNRDSRGDVDWTSVLQVYADLERFRAHNDAATRNAIVAYYVIDGDNPSSVVASLQAARGNARTVRYLIATDLWAHLTAFANYASSLTAFDLAQGRLSHTCGRLIDLCRTHHGILDATAYRDEAWLFYGVGQMIERADQTTRLLDVRHQALMRPDFDHPALEDSRWNLLLRALGGYNAFRRVHPHGLSRERAARFLLLDADFPRSVGACVAGLERQLTDLRRHFGLFEATPALEWVDAMTVGLDRNRVDPMIRHDLHGLTDWIQRQLTQLSELLSERFLNPQR